MKTNFTRILAIAAIGLMAICASASSASAQSAFNGKFTLPQDVNWQGAKLPAGDYTFSLKSTALPSQVIVKGPNGAAIVLTSATSKNEPAQEASNLTIEHRMGVNYVRDLYLAPLGVEFHYAVPKAENGKRELAQGPVSTERILVALSK